MLHGLMVAGLYFRREARAAPTIASSKLCTLGRYWPSWYPGAETRIYFGHRSPHLARTVVVENGRGLRK